MDVEDWPVVHGVWINKIVGFFSILILVLNLRLSSLRIFIGLVRVLLAASKCREDLMKKNNKKEFNDLLRKYPVWKFFKYYYTYLKITYAIYMYLNY